MTNVSTCKPCEEIFEKYYSHALKRQMIQYDYRSKSGELFSCIARDLDQARAKRDEWLDSQGPPKSANQKGEGYEIFTRSSQIDQSRHR